MRLFDAAAYERFWRWTQDPAARGPGVAAARAMLWALVPLFQGASLAKRAVFGAGLWPRTRLDALTVSVGNVTMGGTGKTTLTRLVVEALAPDLECAVLCRGYRSGNRAPVLPVSRHGRVLEGPERCGDEAWLLARWLTGASVVVGRRRAVTGPWAVRELGARAVVLDDGFQYWRLERDVDVVAVGTAEGVGNGRPFPRGPLRERLAGLRRASLLVLYRTGDADPAGERTLRASLTGLAPGVPVLTAWAEPEPPRPLVPGTGVPPSLAGHRVLAFSGLGSPAAFRRTLEACGAVVVGHLDYPDHHPYAAGDLAEVARQVAACGAEFAVTTEKDEARLQGLGCDVPVAVLPVRAGMSPEDRQRLVEVLRAAGDRRRS